MFEKKEVFAEPLEDRLIVQRGKAPEKIGNIVIPDSAKRKSLWGIIKKKGPGTRIYTAHGDWTGETRPMTDLSVGDKVRFSQYAGVDVELDDESPLESDMVVLRYGEILTVEPARPSPKVS